MISSGLEIMPGEEPVASGGFADVFQGTLRGVLVAVKVMKLKSSDQLNRMRKVTTRFFIYLRASLTPRRCFTKKRLFGGDSRT